MACGTEPKGTGLVALDIQYLIIRHLPTTEPLLKACWIFDIAIKTTIGSNPNLAILVFVYGLYLRRTDWIWYLIKVLEIFVANAVHCLNLTGVRDLEKTFLGRPQPESVLAV